MKKATDSKKNEKAGDSCNDKLCPFHGKLSLRGRSFMGEVISAKMQKTATVQWERRHFLPKYERYERRKTRLHAHNPACISAREGDIVKIAETRPVSKTKSFVIIERVGFVKGFKEKQEALEEAKVKEDAKENREDEEVKKRGSEK